MDLATIHSVIVDAWLALDLGLPTEYENMPLSPTPQNAPWARLFWLPVENDEKLQTADKYSGILQIDLIVPAGKGTADLHEYANQVTDFFLPFRLFTSGSVSLRVLGRTPSSVRVGGGWATLTVSVRMSTVLDRVF